MMINRTTNIGEAEEKMIENKEKRITGDDDEDY